MRRIALMAAMSKELEQLKALYNDVEERIVDGLKVWIVREGDKEIFLTESGMGKVCAAVNAVEIIKNFHPDLIVNSGCAGSLAKDVDVKDVVIADDVSYHDVWCWEPNEYGQMQGFPARYKANEQALLKMKEIFKNDNHFHYGLVCSGDTFISKDEDIKKILSHFPNVKAVDMELAAIAQVCYIYNVGFLSIKVISDNPIRYKDGYDQYQNFWSELADSSFSVMKKILQEI